LRAVLQRVSEATVRVDDQITGYTGPGLLVLLGINEEDEENDIDYLVQKITNMRIFGDEAGKMNLSVIDTNGGMLIISQFTLFAQTKKGNRPSFIQAARPEKAIPLYQSFIIKMEKALNKDVGRGIFGADMKVQLVNDGPVTILLDSQNRDL